ncbi:MAG: hypothetical protein IJ458_04615 [Clostridia bacterium]|nr:hypothetical protein [Clostridia bacterium]
MKKLVRYEFGRIDEGVKTDKGVQKAIKGLDTVESFESIKLVIDAGYNGPNDAYCKISGIKKPVVTKNTKVGLAVGDAVEKVSNIIRNDNKKLIAKKGNANKKLKPKEDEIEETFEA